MSATVALMLAAPSGEAAKSGPWGLAIILVLCIACYFLFRSMSRHLRKVREEFPKDLPPPHDGDATPHADTDSAAPGLTKSRSPDARGEQGEHAQREDDE